MTRFRRHILTAAAGLLCLCGLPQSAEAQDVFLRPAMETFVDKDTRLMFPALVDSFQKVRVRKNENPVFGTVVRYEDEAGTCADVYIYSLDTGAKAVEKDEFEKHFRETDEGILKMPEQNLKIQTVKHIEAPDRKAPAPGHEAHYRIQNGSTMMDSILYLALFRGKLIKLRVSYSPDDKDEAASAYRFIDAIAAMLNEAKAAENAASQEKGLETGAPKAATPRPEDKTGA